MGAKDLPIFIIFFVLGGWRQKDLVVRKRETRSTPEWMGEFDCLCVMIK